LARFLTQGAALGCYISPRWGCRILAG